MSKLDTQIKAMLRNPKALPDFYTQGKLPHVIEPASPLITLLLRIAPRDRLGIRGITLGPDLGYSCGFPFANAEQLLRYVRPNRYVTGTFPAESRRIKTFQRELAIDDLLSCASSVDPGIRERYSRIR